MNSLRVSKFTPANGIINTEKKCQNIAAPQDLSSLDESAKFLFSTFPSLEASVNSFLKRTEEGNLEEFSSKEELMNHIFGNGK